MDLLHIHAVGDFDRFWAVYPRRAGANPSKPARISFERALKRGANPERIIAGAARYGAEQRKPKNAGTPFVCMAATWLNQERWHDYPEETVAAVVARTWVLRDDPRWQRLADMWRAESGKEPPTIGGEGGQGWRFPTAWLERKEAGERLAPHPASGVATDLGSRYGSVTVLRGSLSVVNASDGMGYGPASEPLNNPGNQTVRASVTHNTRDLGAEHHSDR